MKPRLLHSPLVALAIALALGVAGAASAQGGDAQLIRVSTARELVRAIGPNRTVLLEEGTYELAEAYGVPGEFASWEEVHDGQQLVLREVEGLTLRADADQWVTILAEPRYAFVLALVDCAELCVENLTLGHTEAGYCTGGVIYLERCGDLRIEGCDLYGSGTVGLEVVESTDVAVRATTIRGCTYGAVSIDDSADVVFREVELVDNEAWPLVGVYGSSGVRFEDCWIQDNAGDALFYIDASSDAVALPGTYLDGNDTDYLASEDGLAPDLSDAVLGQNLFDVEDEGYYEDGEYEEGEYEGEYYEDYGEEYEEEYPDEREEPEPQPGGRR